MKKQSLKERIKNMNKFLNDEYGLNVFGENKKIIKYGKSYVVLEVINNKNNNQIVGSYIRVGKSEKEEQKKQILKQGNEILKYYSKNKITNYRIYIDIGKSSLNLNRKALNLLIKDIEEEKIKSLVITDISRLYRNLADASVFVEKTYLKNVKLISLDNSLESTREFMNLLTYMPLNEETKDYNNDEEYEYYYDGIE